MTAEQQASVDRTLKIQHRADPTVYGTTDGWQQLSPKVYIRSYICRTSSTAETPEMYLAVWWDTSAIDYKDGVLVVYKKIPTQLLDRTG